MLIVVGHTCCTPRRSARQPRRLPTARLLRCWHDQVAGTRSIPRHETNGWLAPQARAAAPAARCFAPWPECAPRRRQGQTSAAYQAATGPIPGVSQPARFGHSVSGSTENGTPVQNTVTKARLDCYAPSTLAFHPSSQSTDLSTYPQVRTPPAPHPHPPLPPPALSGYLDEASASSRVDFSMRHLGSSQGLKGSWASAQRGSPLQVRRKSSSRKL